MKFNINALLIAALSCSLLFAAQPPTPPVAPVAPTTPVAPVAPTAPTAPTMPVAPTAPTAPVAPAAPAIPTAPTTPVAPATPVATAPAATTMGDIIAEATKIADLSSFLQAVQIAGKTEDAKMTTPPAPFIVFAPNNAAFTAANLAQTKDVYKPLVKYLVTTGIKDIAAQAKDKLPAELETLAGPKIAINADKTVGATEKANITQSITCTNGTIHIIDKMLTPVK